VSAGGAARAAWRPIDCHAHTTMSDGALDVAELAATARARGVRPSVADHVSRDVRGAVASLTAVEAYLDELERHEVARAAEFCWHDALWRELPERVMARFTHRVGSLHGVVAADGTVVHAFAPRLPAALSPAAYMALLIDNLERLTREMPVEILAHPTLLPIPFRRLPLEELWTEAHEERAVAALARAGIAMEISNRYRPHERLVARAHAAGVRLSLGSDGHAPEQVADLAWPLALARRVGVPDEALYDPWVHGRRG
jgi:histidinol phosphatase-like PHP family hydrolase